MIENRIEKKFVFQPGDKSIDYLLIDGFFKKIFKPRLINTIYLDTLDFKNIWDNINGFSKRTKHRIRWYNNIEDDEVFFEEKNKKNQTTIKNKIRMGKFKSEDDLLLYLNSSKFTKDFGFKYRFNLKKILKVSYKRSYFSDPKNKVRITFDENIFVNRNVKKKQMGLFLDNNILEVKYNILDSNYCNSLLLNSKITNRNKKYSKYVQSFLNINESGLI